MDQSISSELQSAFERLTWSGSEELTPAGAVVFKEALDQADSFRDDPEVLAAAVRTLRTCDSLPYTYAGLAYALLVATKAEGNSGERALQAALEWLEKAQEMEPDVVDINVIEALIYIQGGRIEDARMVLDYLHNQDPNSFLLKRAEMAYWQEIGDYEQALAWNQNALQEAETVPQRLRLKSAAARLYLQAGREEKALEAYKEALHFDPKNAWLCHRISTMHYERDELEEAARFNERALELSSEMPEAQQLRETLKERLGSTGLLGRLFG